MSSLENKGLTQTAESDELMRQTARRAAGFFALSLLYAVLVGGALGGLLLASLTTRRDWLFGLGADGVRRAHAFAQVFGFAALYVMGVAFHVLPRLTGRPLLQLSAVPWALVGGALGPGLAVALSLAEVHAAWAWTWVYVSLVIAAGAFAYTISSQLRGAQLLGPMAAYLVAGCLWFVLAAALPLTGFWRGAAPHVLQTAVWEAMLWGFAASWIYGMSLRILPAAVGAPWQPARLDVWVWAAHQIGALAWVAAHALAPQAWWSESTARACALIGGVLLCASALTYVQRVGVFTWPRVAVAHPLPGTEKFLLAAYFWLMVAALEGPAWSAGHAYFASPYGGSAMDFARHAFTLGFLSQMIFGVSMRVIPTAAGLPLWSPCLRDLSFWLLNASVILRVSEVVAFVRGFAWLYPWAAVSGLLGWLAFVAFTVNVVMTLRGAGGRR